ncbi:MAG TPA: fibronectin type III domain-containing protein [Trebonia sp.]|jgi:hypothetical protein
MVKFRRRTLACTTGAVALAAGCMLAGIGVSQASAATAKPAEVSGLAVKEGTVTTDGATLTWNADAGATSFRVVIVNASTPTAAASYDSDDTLKGTSVTVSTLEAGTAYEAKIGAEGAGGSSEWSPWVVFYTTAAPGSPGAPGHQGSPGSSGVISTKTYPLPSANGPAESVLTGGSFTSRKTTLGTVTLAPGTYLLSVNFVATPSATASGNVFPQAFVYDGAAKSDFSNDIFNVGSGALSSYNTSSTSDQVNSYYSGTTVITVPADSPELDVYAFGYDSDQGSSSYEMNSFTLTATQLDVAQS